MATNPLFDTDGALEEQNIVDGLVRESIQIHGRDVFYLPRKLFDEDALLTEDAQSYFDDAVPIDMYLKSFDSFSSMGSQLSNFGVIIPDTLTFTVSITTFLELVAANYNQTLGFNKNGDPEPFTRPREGDLIYFPVNKRCFEITFTDKWTALYPLGALYMYDMTCELYQYSGEKFSTGIHEIDSIVPDLSQDIFDWSITTEDGHPILTEDGNYIVAEKYDSLLIDPLDQSDEIQTEADAVLTWTELDPYQDGPF